MGDEAEGASTRPEAATRRVIVAGDVTVDWHLARIHAGNRKPDTMEPTTLGDEQGQVDYENFWTS